MHPNVAEQILDELLPSFELRETQSAAVLQFLKDNKIATDEQSRLEALTQSAAGAPERNQDRCDFALQPNFGV
jgi:hypothetical protein